MSDAIRDYLVPDGADLAAVLAELHRRRRLNEGPWLASEHHFLDSFDWRLFLAGAMLEQCSDTEGARLIWHDSRRADAQLVQGCEGLPGLLSDLEAGPVHEQLAPVLGIRRLLPVITILSREQTLYIAGDADQTIARLQVIISEWQDPTSGERGPLAARLRLEALAGQADEAGALASLLKDTLGLRRARNPPFVEALAAAGRQPGGYSTKLDFRLEGDVRADVSTKSILRHLLGTLTANIPGAKARLDPEFLHDLRVATRRTRSALGQIKGVFPPNQVAYYKGRFAWLQQVTGPVRDLDVYQQSLGDYLAALPPLLRPYLAPLEEYLVAHHRLAQRQLTEVLSSAELAQLIDDWRAFLDEAPGADCHLPSAGRPIKEIADVSIWRIYRRVRNEGRAIGPESPPTELHELRKSSKKLRYLMEFFSSLYPKDELAPLIKLTKVLLDNLGLFQDLAVQGEFLRDAAREMAVEGQADADTLLAMGALIGSLLHRQQEARSAFAATFGALDTSRNRAAFRKLFKPAA
jgi:CHAD domain-containing protein